MILGMNSKNRTRFYLYPTPPPSTFFIPIQSRDLGLFGLGLGRVSITAYVIEYSKLDAMIESGQSVRYCWW